DTILREVGLHYDLNRSSMTRVRRGMENEARDVAMYLIRSLRSEPLMKVGAGFGLNRYSSVSSAVMRVKSRLQKDKQFRNRLEHIEGNILKGQS
ncbi:MAG: helix-turn-helix domain-containing protein, partial [Pseudomonadota bacterium]